MDRSSSPTARPRPSTPSTAWDFAIVLPELEPLRGLIQNRYHHLDAFDHTLAAVEAADDLRGLARGLLPLAFAIDPLAPAPRDARLSPLAPERARMLRWSLLLHDTGKAPTRTLGEDGEYHLHVVSARIAPGALRRLRPAGRAAIERLVFLHLRVSIPAREASPAPRWRTVPTRISHAAPGAPPSPTSHSGPPPCADHARSAAPVRSSWRGVRTPSVRRPVLPSSGARCHESPRDRSGPEVGIRLEDRGAAGIGALTTREEGAPSHQPPPQPADES
jgi:hypothetical protein